LNFLFLIFPGILEEDIKTRLISFCKSHGYFREQYLLLHSDGKYKEAGKFGWREREGVRRGTRRNEEGKEEGGMRRNGGRRRREGESGRGKRGTLKITSSQENTCWRWPSTFPKCRVGP
jgi:hypothetical protein